VRARWSLLLVVLLLVGAPRGARAESEPGLLFYVSGEHGLAADVAASGDAEPTFVRDVKVIPDGARGNALECAGSQLLAYRAPGNVYAERGTLAFYWRSRDPVGPTAFPIFRVAYSDHSSWDMVWLRIDYNGQRGFDAFVTDVNLARVRVSSSLARFPEPKRWAHLAFSWDETLGVRLYVDGVRVAKQDAVAVLHAGLDQLGPHSRVIGPMQVQSAYNFTRGGDIDEIRIYDRMLSDADVAALAAGRALGPLPALARDLSQRRWHDEWWLRHGWNRKGDVPAHLDSPATSVRKVEIHDVYDLKRWWWKATDGIRETTWPGVYNRSRLPGRNDYFQLPDWDCYSLSGRSVTFQLPDEPWNQLEISGAAAGAWSLAGSGAPAGSSDRVLLRRPMGQERTFHRLPAPLRAGLLRFDNLQPEEPIGELSAYQVSSAPEPTHGPELRYVLGPGSAAASEPSLAPLLKFIAGRYAPDERATLVAALEGACCGAPRDESGATARSLPAVHVLIPAAAWASFDGGLDGIAIDLPALPVKATHGAYFPLQLEIKDPLWPARNLLDFSFSVRPGEARSLWLDTRDRILPPGKALYLTLAGAGADFDAAALTGARIRLKFKPRQEARAEHELDRFTQARDSYAMLLEERAHDRRFDLYNRFAADIGDVLRVNPGHWLAQAYAYDSTNAAREESREAAQERPLKPTFILAEPPPGVPAWAFRQVELLGYLERLVLWYIDHRQIENGEFGGGLSDDGDLTNFWPGAALMGVAPEKLARSLSRELEAFYEQGMMRNGLPVIQTDELHAYEEGISTLGQMLLLEPGNPRLLERAMETTRALLQLSAINPAGHRHLRSRYFSATRVAEEPPWGGSERYSYLMTQVVLQLVEYSGNPAAKQLVVELADALLAHRKRDASGNYRLTPIVNFRTDEDQPGISDHALPLLWAAWRFTGNAEYLLPTRDLGLRGLQLLPFSAPPELGLSASAAFAAAAEPQPEPVALQLAWQSSGDTRFLERLYATQSEAAALREYINTEGSIWIDRVFFPTRELQQARLGGVALARNSYFPGHVVSWKFAAPADPKAVALLVRSPSSSSLQVVAHNLSAEAVRASMTAWGLEPGRWRVSIGIDRDGDQVADGALQQRDALSLERGGSLELEFPAGVTSVASFTLQERAPGPWSKPDLGISRDDVVLGASALRVTVHSLGSVDAPASELALVGSDGKLHAVVPIPALRAPLDLKPQTVTLSVPAGAARGASIVIDPASRLREITRSNNRVEL
jgi:hypothetical protein